MEIEGPIRISVVENPNSVNRELHLDFTRQFKAIPLAEQTTRFRLYLDELQRAIASLPEGSADRQGMLTVFQIAEQLLPHITTGQLALEETIVVEIQPALSFGPGIPGLSMN